MRNLKFQYKLYLLSFFLMGTFALSSYLYQSNISNISNNIQALNYENETLKNTLVLVSEIEKLNKNVQEFINLGNEDVLSSIAQSINEFEKLKANSTLISENEIFLFSYNQVMKNISRLRSDFEIAKIHVPLNFEFRRQVRVNAQILEEKLEKIDNTSMTSEIFFNLVLLKKSILQIEKGLVRYFETNDGSFVNKTKIEQKNLITLFEQLSKNSNIPLDDINLLRKKISELVYLVNKTISHYRTYSMITKVVIPGDLYEINYNSKKIREITIQNIDQIKDEINKLLHLNKNSTVMINIVYIILIFTGFFSLIRVLLKPLEKLTVMFEELLEGKQDVKIPEYKQNDIVGKLIKVAIEFKFLNKKTNELLVQTEDYKENLEIKVQEEINLRRDQEKILMQQSKLASMGEMIGAIAHQWRQPLNELSIRIQKLKYNYANEQINEEFIQEFIEKNKNTISFMSKTIDDFRNFFRIDKEKKSFNVKNAIEEVINIQNAQLKNHNISLELSGVDFIYEGYKTEFQQVIINLISNAKDALVSNDIKDPEIKIEIKENLITIQDNGGGISDEIINRVFEPYFTTKDQGEGTGMGLYMSKMIIEDNMHGKISMNNIKDGVLVSISLKV